MDRTRYRGFYYLLAFMGALLFYTILYKFGMAAFEGTQRTLLESFQVVVQSFTTTGYGEDAGLWNSPQMLVMAILMQFTGVFLIFLTLPLFVVPWIQHRLEDRIPTAYSGTDHVAICGFSERGNVLVEELANRDIEYVVLLEDTERAKTLHDSGYTVAVGDLESVGSLSNVNVESARAVVLDGSDEKNASIALSVRELTDSIRLIAFVEDADLTRYLELAGVDTALHPRELLGRGLADKVSSVITTQLGKTVDIGADLEVIELPVLAGCQVEGSRLGTAGIREETGATVIGVWLDGEFVPNPGPETKLDNRTVLLVSGTESQLESVMDRTLAADRPAQRDVVIAGYGDVGESVCEALRSSHISCQVIDVLDKEGVDVVGNATTAEVLRSAGIESAGGLIVTVSTDSDAIFTTLVARELNPELEIIVRANDAENSGKLYSAGADYVLPLTTVSGRMLASAIHDEDVISYDTQIDIVRLKAPAFEGQTVEEAAIRERTGCTVIAVERDEETYTEIGPSFELQADDTLVVVGTDDDLVSFQEIAGSLRDT